MPPRHPDIARALGPVRATLKRLREREGLPREARLGLLVGCSGGRDSVALAGLLALVAKAERLSLTLGHIDHGLRGESEAEADHVVQLGARLGLEVRVCRLQLDRAAKGLPARAREARHAALREVRTQVGAHRIALAHTATDQAETVLLHLSRGAGLRGLGGMRAVDPVRPVVRPLLELPRSETAILCTHLGLPFVDDPTNANADQPRIRVRDVVLPALETGRGGVEPALAASARAAREAEDALQVWIDRERKARARGGDVYDLSEWRGLPRAIRVGVVQAIAVHAGAAVDEIGRRTLDAIDRGLLAGGAKRWMLSGGACVWTDGDVLAIRGPQRERTPPAEPT